MSVSGEVTTLPLTVSVEKEWELQGIAYPESRLFAVITVCGTRMYLEAIEVKLNEDDASERDDDLPPRPYDVCDPVFESVIVNLEADQETDFQTTEIGGRHYILFATSAGA